MGCADVVYIYRQSSTAPCRSARAQVRFPAITSRVARQAPYGARAIAAIGLLGTIVPAQATVITGPVSLSVFTSGATHGPPAPAHFTEPGPITVTSGTATPLFTGPSYGDLNSLLLVISGAIPTGDVITLTFDGLASVNFTAANFVSTAAAGFPTGPGGINGIANGDVNGVAFPTALHAGADVTGLPTGLSTDQLLGEVTISQTIGTNLRVMYSAILTAGLSTTLQTAARLGSPEQHRFRFQSPRAWSCSERRCSGSVLRHGVAADSTATRAAGASASPSDQRTNPGSGDGGIGLGLVEHSAPSGCSPELHKQCVGFPEFALLFGLQHLGK